ncbi:unnamed protein product [Sphenostylis stenocarpa]|uniref:Uncharacterized protein n=1 Tax=Sphenostylis stenocarpa TaxID=92480 RepID=A0AA86RV10_9FABA|nr:unnamed protein product [Sphenostylis stenocarpa]
MSRNCSIFATYKCSVVTAIEHKCCKKLGLPNPSSIRDNVFDWHKANRYNLNVLPNFHGGKDWEVWKIIILIFESKILLGSLEDDAGIMKRSLVNLALVSRESLAKLV